MPVHLGSMDRSVETIIRENPPHRPGRRVRAQRALQRRHPSARHHGGARRCSTPGQREPILFWVASRGHHADVGGIAPGSMSPRATTSRRKASHRQLQAGRPRPLPREGTARAADRREYPVPQPGPEHRRPQGPDRRQREGRAGAAQDGARSSASTWCRPTWATCRTMPPKACAGDRRAARLRVRLRDGPGHVIKVKITVDKEEARRRPSTSPAPARSSRPTSTRPSR
jgi:hypothetical protein